MKTDPTSTSDSTSPAPYLSVILLWVGAVFAILVMLLLSGCTSAQQVPRSVVSFATPQGWKSNLELPKDAKLKKLHVEIATNGSVIVDIEGLDVRTNPEVVSASGQSFVDGVAAGGEVFSKGLEAGIKATGKAVIPVP